MKSVLEKLREYLSNTPREEVLALWESTKEWDNIGPTIEEFFKVNINCELEAEVKPKLNTMTEEKSGGNFGFFYLLTSAKKFSTVHDKRNICFRGVSVYKGHNRQG